MDLATWWLNLTDAQAQVISTVLAGVGLLIGAWLGVGLVGDQVKKSKEELKKSAREEMAKIQELVAAIQVKTNELQAMARDNEPDGEGSVVQTEDRALWKELYDTWDKLRDRLERIAADERIDGRRRAKYARLDRRSYYALLSSLAEDGVVGSEKSDWERAIRLWYENRRKVTVDGVRALRELQAILAPG